MEFVERKGGLSSCERKGRERKERRRRVGREVDIKLVLIERR